MFVKETSTCKYSLVIHTPRLCGEPGFKSRAEHTEAAPIRCRQIMDDPPPSGEGSLRESAHPGGQRRHQSIAGTTKPGSGPKPKEKEKKDDPIANKVSLLTKLLDTLKRGASDMDLSLVSVEEGDNGEQYWVLEGDEDILTQLAGEVDKKQEGEGSEKRSQDKRRPHQEL